ncbi:hypothetical protein BDV39DRAFT_168627 [Aspergillus sergii]|uniref:Uncharacterized protein n=1 Tax=Aspergillus sergii TaxID=1034303 RepID=A0A5N6XEZ5_9EURO|nr:hypothetical protein BDV39DRAFT_168627 [Aspergillus sergii]
MNTASPVAFVLIWPVYTGKLALGFPFMLLLVKITDVAQGPKKHMVAVEDCVSTYLQLFCILSRPMQMGMQNDVFCTT